VPEHSPVPIVTVLGLVLVAVRQHRALSLGLDDYTNRHPDVDNVAIRWLSRREGYEVTLRFGAAPIVAALSPVKRSEPFEEVLPEVESDAAN
jgi:hypothetical protein